MFLLQEKLKSPVVKLLRAGNLDFILSFFYHIFRNKEKNIDTIKQNILEKELNIFIWNYNKKVSKDKKKSENSKILIEEWIKKEYLKRIKLSDFDDDFEIELTSHSLQVMSFLEAIGISKIKHSSVGSTFENILSNLKDIALSSEDLKTQNLENIDKQIKILEEKKRKIEAWELQVFEDDVLDKYVSAKELLTKLPVEFKKVEDIFKELALEIQKKGAEQELNKWKILWEILWEIETKINSSPQWKSFDWFNKFYDENNREFFEAIEKVLQNFPKIDELEKEKKIKDIILVDLLKARKNVMNKKTFIVSKLREIFNEEYIEERQRWIKVIKNIKKFVWEKIEDIDYKKDYLELNDWFEIDLFLWKNLWEPKKQQKIAKFTDTKTKSNDIDLQEIFRNAWVSENKLIWNINEFLQEKEEVSLKEVIEKNKIEYWLDEFVSYVKIAIDWKWEILKRREKFDIKWLEYRMWVESGKIVFRKWKINLWQI